MLLSKKYIVARQIFLIKVIIIFSFIIVLEVINSIKKGDEETYSNLENAKSLLNCLIYLKAGFKI